jgi:hypothetical protein
MPRQRKHRKSDTAKREGPIQPGSPLHRLLQQVAQEVAKTLETRPERSRVRRTQ